MLRFLHTFFRKRPKLSKRRVCFTVENMEEMCDKYPGCIPDLETALPPEGAFPIRSDVRSKVICVEIYAEDVSVEDIQNFIASHGFQLTLKEDQTS